MVTVALPVNILKPHWVVHFKWVNCMYVNCISVKVVMEKKIQGKFCLRLTMIVETKESGKQDDLDCWNS